MIQSLNAAQKKHIRSTFRKVADNLPSDLSEQPEFQEKFERTVSEIYAKFKKGTYYRNIELVLPYILYMFLRIKQIVFRKKDYLRLFNIKRDEFNTHLKRLMRVYPQYQTRDRTQAVINKLKSLSDKYGLGPLFLKRCELIFRHYYHHVDQTTTSTAAAFIGGLTFLTFENESEILSLRIVCEQLGCIPGSFYNAVKRYLLSKEEQSQFAGIIGSKELILGKIMARTGLEPEEIQIPLPITPKKHPKPERKSNLKETDSQEEIVKHLDAKMEAIVKKAAQMRKEAADQKAQKPQKPQKLISKYTTPSHEKRGYPLTQQDKKDIIKLHLKDRTAKKISFDLNIKKHIVKSVIEAFSEGTIHIATSPAPAKSSGAPATSGLHLLSDNPFPQHGELNRIEKLRVRCEQCDNPLLKLTYTNGKVVFFCKYCYN